MKIVLFLFAYFRLFRTFVSVKEIVTDIADVLKSMNEAGVDAENHRFAA